VRLSVASDNPIAVRLYERVGMRQAWRVDDYQKALPD
jgi:mycothiol synthase